MAKSALNELREIHLLTTMYNNGMRSIFFVALLGTGIAQIIPVVVLIRTTSLSFVITIFFVSLAIQASLIILIVYGFAGNVHTVSKVSLAKLEQVVRSGNFGRFNQRYLERFLSSCQILKIKFGMSNFIEKSTPPIFQLFCIERCIDLLLLY